MILGDKMNNELKISLIMAAYNAEKYIEAAIESILKQTYRNWELIIVDDGSVDRTPIIVDEYAKLDERIKVVHTKNSGTAAAARNVALEYISGNYVQMVDADDLIKQDLLSVYADKLRIHEYDILIPNCICFENDDINKIFWKKNAPQNNFKQTINGEKGFELSLDWTIHGFFLIRTDIVLRIKYDPLLLNGDELTTRKFLFNAKKIGFVDSYYYYRKNLESTTQSKKNKYRMYETVLTDINIYNYAVSNHMEQRIIDKCSNMLIRSFCGYCRKFYKYSDTSSDETSKQASGILLKAFDFITEEMWNKAPMKYRIFYIMSKGKYNRFANEMKLISKF